MTDPDPQGTTDEKGWMWSVGKVKNERNDIVTREESTPKMKVRLQGVNLHNYTRGEGGMMGQGESKRQKEWKVRIH
jgi:hypothetical protein